MRVTGRRTVDGRGVRSLRKYILIGVVAFLAFALVLMPASVARLATDRLDGLVMRTVGGTLWDGHANLAYRGQRIGNLEWTFMPIAVLSGEVRVRWRLADADTDLSGIATQGLGHASVNASGHVGATAVNRVLGRYEIAINGDFETTDLGVVSDESTRASGVIAWSGGRNLLPTVGSELRHGIAGDGRRGAHGRWGAHA